MEKMLYLVQTRAARNYRCENWSCNRVIRKGEPHFRHDPYPFDFLGRIRRRSPKPRTHWCYECIAAVGLSKDPDSGRIRVPVVDLLSSRHASRLALLQIEVVDVGAQLAALLADEPKLIHRLTPGQFEELVCERLHAMGLEPQRVGGTFHKDGAIDILFWPRHRPAFPFLGAAQVKHHRNPATKEGPASVREFAGVLSGHPFSVGLLVTNTTFTPDAEWFARKHAPLLRLRDFDDLRRWLAGDFEDSAEWREIPHAIEVCPGFVVQVRARGRADLSG